MGNIKKGRVGQVILVNSQRTHSVLDVHTTGVNSHMKRRTVSNYTSGMKFLLCMPYVCITL
jgi:hypothetical protein